MDGRIVRLVRERGFGFIRNDNSGEEYFFHRSGCHAPFAQLQENDAVSFETEHSAKGPRATTVTPLTRQA